MDSSAPQSSYFMCRVLCLLWTIAVIVFAPVQLDMAGHASQQNVCMAELHLATGYDQTP